MTSRLHTSEVVYGTGLSGAATRPPKPPHGEFIYYSEFMAVRTIDLNSTASTVSDTTTETEIASLDLPALTLATDGAIRMKAWGALANSSDPGSDVTFKVKLATPASTSTLFATSGIAVSTSTATRAWSVDAVVLAKGPADQWTWGGASVSAAPSAGVTLIPSTYEGGGAGSATLDEEQAMSISVTVTLSTASTGFSVTRQAAVLEGLA